jgi:hypothetical protein
MFLNNINVSDFITVDFAGINTTTTQQFTFPDIPYLRDKKVFCIALNTATLGVDTGLSNVGWLMSDSGTGTGLVNRSAFLTLYDNFGNQFIQNLPLQELISTSRFTNAISPNRLLNQSTYQRNGLTIFAPRIIQWTKCNIYFPLAMNSPNLCFQFDIFYQFKK